MKAWRYLGPDKADLNDLYSVGPEAPAEYDEAGELITAEIRPVLRAFKADLVPGETFEAPDDWQPSPNPHPLFELVGSPVRTNKVEE